MECCILEEIPVFNSLKPIHVPIQSFWEICEILPEILIYTHLALSHGLQTNKLNI